MTCACPQTSETPAAAGPDGVPARRLVLASTSPRRRRLLAEAGFAFDWLDAGVDEGVLAGDAPPVALVLALAHLKAVAGASLLEEDPHALVLGADTLCAIDGRAIGKPRDEAEARRTIRALAGGEHEVLTGVSILEPGGGRRELLVDRARVTIGPLGEDDIEAYIAGGAWRGKAGGYNLFERIDAGWPLTFSGDPATIVGLPMQRLAPILNRRAGAPC